MRLRPIGVLLFTGYESEKGTFMIEGLGIDVVDIDRFENCVERWGDHFLTKIFTPQEITYCRTKVNAIPSLAVRFAAKEALIKCLNDSESSLFRWHTVEVINTETGKPGILLSGPLKTLLLDRKITLSLTHSRRSAVAVVIIQARD